MRLFLLFIFMIFLGELLHLIRQKKGIRIELIIALTVLSIATIWGNMLEANTGIIQDKFWQLTVANAALIFVPIAILFVAIELSVKRYKGLVNHISIVFVAMIATFISLWVDLNLSCDLGLGCV